MYEKPCSGKTFKNKFYQEVAALEEQGASSKSLQELLGKGRAKKGMHLET